MGRIILYVTFIDMDIAPQTASSVRPQRMYQAFLDTDFEVKLLSGMDNRYRERKLNVKNILNWLDYNKPEMCYIEPPSGPFLCPEDLKLLKVLHHKNIPTAIFYRDAYWRFPYMGLQKAKIYTKLKQMVVHYMQRRDWNVIVRTCSHIYFPSMSLAAYFNADNVSALPPGCEILSEKWTDTSPIEVPTAIYVGGATKRYGIYLILDAFAILNAEKIRAKLSIICPKEQWECVEKEYHSYLDTGWLEVNHISGKEKLQEKYRNSSFALLPILKSEYNDVAVPVKLYEYVSYLKPVISTQCNEIEQIVTNNGIGIVTKDNPADFAQAAASMIENSKRFEKYKENCSLMRSSNTWAKRAETIIKDLTGV